MQKYYFPRVVQFNVPGPHALLHFFVVLHTELQILQCLTKRAKKPYYHLRL